MTGLPFDWRLWWVVGGHIGGEKQEENEEGEEGKEEDEGNKEHEELVVGRLDGATLSYCLYDVRCQMARLHGTKKHHLFVQSTISRTTTIAITTTKWIWSDLE